MDRALITSTPALMKQGGISRCVIELVERCPKEDVVHVITSQLGDYKFKKPNVFVHRIHIPQKPKFLEAFLRTVLFTRKANELRKTYDDFCLVHGNGSDILFPNVLTFHSIQKAGVVDSRTEWWYMPLKFYEPRSNVVLFVEKLNAEIIDRVHSYITVSDGEKYNLMTMYPRKRYKMNLLEWVFCKLCGYEIQITF